MPRPFRIVCLLALFASVPAVLAVTPEQRLEADHAAWSAARANYAERLAAGGLGEAERRDYAVFVDDLAARVLEGCLDLRTRGRPLPAGVDCPAPGAASSAVELVDPREVSTVDEGRAALDAELGASLGQFDELLLREQDRVRAARPRSESRAGERGAGTASSSAHAGEGASTASAGGPARQGAAGDVAAEGRRGAAGSATSASTGTPTGQGWPGSDPTGQEGTASGGSAGDPGQGGLGAPGGRGTGAATPAELPDPSGDDVVARQIREAAERERDPGLRARLWDEYRRYRSGID